MNFFLANPAWEALSTHQSYLNQGDDTLKYFPADICPFAGLPHWNNDDINRLATTLPHNRSFSVPVSKEIHFPDSIEVLFAIPLYQTLPGHGYQFISVKNAMVISKLNGSPVERTRFGLLCE